MAKGIKKNSSHGWYAAGNRYIRMKVDSAGVLETN